METSPRISTIPPEPDRYPVVVVDGDARVHRTASSALGGRGYLVVPAPDALAALRITDERGPVILVVDVDSAEVDGFGLAAELRRSTADAEVVLTGTATPDALLRALELGAFRFLRKPVDVTELLTAVAGAANRLFLRIDRRRHIAALEERNEALEGAMERLAESESRRALVERLASIGQFASALGHEINGPLAYVQTNLDLARDWVTEVADAADHFDLASGGHVVARARERLQQLPAALEDCNTGLRFMRQLSRDLGAVARYQVDVRSLFDLNDVVLTACRIARVKVRPPNRLIVTPAHRSIPVVGSQGRLAQVVMNLVSNAVDATDDLRPNTICVATEVIGEHAHLTVTDTGVGIPEERRARIFEPYVSYRPGGTGIGLGVVKHIVDEHAGRVSVVSELAQGTRFEVVLPLSHERLPDPATTSSTPPQTDATGRIVVVDDDALIRRGVARALSTGFELRTVASAAAALEAIAAELPDLIVTDVDMPSLDGIAFHAEVARRWPALTHRFLFVTGDPERVPSGLGPVLEKPFGVAKLRKAILKALR